MSCTSAAALGVRTDPSDRGQSSPWLLFTGKSNELASVWVFHKQVVTAVVFREQADCKRQCALKQVGKRPLTAQLLFKGRKRVMPL